MRNAEELLSPNQEIAEMRGDTYVVIEFNAAVQAINEARIEAIKECAELCSEREDNRGNHSGYILNLISELK